jgi:hypothetical protein
METFIFDGIELFDLVDPGGVVLGTKGLTGIVAKLLSGGDFAIEAAEEVDEPGVVVEVSFGVLGGGQFLEEELREASGGGLESDFGYFRGIIAPEEVEKVVLVEAVLEDSLLFEPPFEVASGSPVGDVSFVDGEAGIVEGGHDVFVRDVVPEHAVDHVAFEFGEGSNAAMAAELSRVSRRGQGFGVDHRDGFGGRDRSRDGDERSGG